VPHDAGFFGSDEAREGFLELAESRGRDARRKLEAAGRDLEADIRRDSCSARELYEHYGITSGRLRTLRE
jgi:hypothetical protein